MRRMLNRLAALATGAVFALGTGVVAFAAGDGQAAALRVCIPLLSVLAVLGLGLMLLIAYRRFRRHEG